MKLLLTIILTIFTVNSYAESRLPTEQEFEEINKTLDSNDSLRPIIKAVNENKLNPIYEWYGTVVSKPGRSSLFLGLLLKRFDVDSGYKGDLKENLELLELLINKGVNLNVKQPSNFLNTEDLIPLSFVSTSCSIDLLNLLIENGADPSLDSNLWIMSNYLSTSEKLSAPIRKDCALIAEYFLSNAKNLKPRTIHLQFGLNGEEEDFTGGENLRSYLSPSMIDIFNSNFGVKFSVEPTSEIPSDEWYEQFLFYLKRPVSDDYFQDQRINYKKANAWWENQSKDLKQWACYYSTFDEVIGLLVQAGQEESMLMTSPTILMASWRYRSYGVFSIKVFKPYCDSIK